MVVSRVGFGALVLPLREGVGCDWNERCPDRVVESTDGEVRGLDDCLVDDGSF
ncbi:MAG: hypothetical protein KDI30_06305 [Pseudomonadales bacterium]|nr:hypothetical protein [Pseudomonadales bacterium]